MDGIPSSWRAAPQTSPGARGSRLRLRITATTCRPARIRTHLARRRIPHGSGLGHTRWVVELTVALHHRFRRLNVRYERRDRIHTAFVLLGCSPICWNLLKPLIYF